MVIKEKELARLMKDAYRGGGYTVAVRGNGKTVICTNAWAVEVDNASLPREALSMMALHMGFLPEPDEAFTIYKGNKEPTVQTKDFNVAVQCITQLDALLEEAEARKTRVRKTVLTYNGYSIWQQGSGSILLIDPVREQLLYKKDNVLSVGTTIFAGDSESRVYIICQPKPEIRILQSMAEVSWPTVQ